MEAYRHDPGRSRCLSDNGLGPEESRDSSPPALRPAVPQAIVMMTDDLAAARRSQQEQPLLSQGGRGCSLVCGTGRGRKSCYCESQDAPKLSAIGRQPCCPGWRRVRLGVHQQPSAYGSGFAICICHVRLPWECKPHCQPSGG